ncbi:MAG TPA: MaoC/PaaZ C-terminal domain-containing protein [Candidatus Dormibacteraeota bacterium]|nr:MaoC/PaaZ C-terminal domain-containing protein [Candidatus Dormibacteraeota bacterium]
MDLLHYEDLELGGKWTTRGRTVTDADIAAFAGVSGDFGFLHLDGPRAAQGQFGGRIAHGSLLIAIALGLGAMDVPQPQTVAMVGTNWRFLKPVKPGMTVHAGWRLGRKRDVTNPRWGLCTWQVELIDQGGDQVMEGEVTILVARREGAAAAAVSRSRRRRRGKAPAAAVEAMPTAEANLPEPAPADTPPPARRRRRSGGGGSRTDAPPVPEEAVPVAETTAAEAAPTSSPARRRRRRRGGGGSGGAGGNGGDGGAPGATTVDAPAPPAQQPEPEPPRSTWATPEVAQPESNNPVRRALGRLRRPRTSSPAE